MTQAKQYVCTRPSLVTELIKRGHTPKVEPSPWGDKKTAWIFDVNEDLRRTVDAFYKRIGKRSPLEISDEIEKDYSKRDREVRA